MWPTRMRTPPSSTSASHGESSAQASRSQLPRTAVTGAMALQAGQHLRRADVAGVDDVVDAPQQRLHLGVEMTVGVGEHSDDDRSSRSAAGLRPSGTSSSNQVVGEQVVAQVVAGRAAARARARTGPATRLSLCVERLDLELEEGSRSPPPARPGPGPRPRAGRPRRRCGAPVPCWSSSVNTPGATEERGQVVRESPAFASAGGSTGAGRTVLAPGGRPASRRPPSPGAVKAPVGQTKTHSPQKVQPDSRRVPCFG